MMNVLDRLKQSGVVPVVVLDNAKDAAPTAKALLAGSVDVMEITFRTAAAADSIKAVAESCPDMLVGAGTVVTLDQCKKAVECGAKFIVAPGFDEEVVRWCVENGVAVTPGCVTPTEIMAAMKLGLKVVKFFPAGVYGGLSAMKALSGGLVTDARLPFVFLREYANVVPIWGFQKMEELNQIIDMEQNPPVRTDEIDRLIERDRRELSGAFCRSCGYCLPCPADIKIPQANRMMQLLGRAVWQNYVTSEWQREMEKIENCVHCGACAKRCPYGLKPYESMREQLKGYREFVKTHTL